MWRPSDLMHGNMKEPIILLAILMVTGCDKPEGLAPEEPGNPDSVYQLESTGKSEPSEMDSDYAKGVVTLKTGRIVTGYILLQCPGYLAVYSGISSPDPNRSELVPYEEVQSVKLEKPLRDVDVLWMSLRREMTIITPEAITPKAKKGAETAEEGTEPIVD